jgi:hypothetical protein
MKKIAIALSMTAFAGACADDAPVEESPDAGTDVVTQDFTIRIENIAPWTVLKSGLQNVKVVPSAGPLGPGEAWDITFTAGKGQKLSFAAMLGESNDWFFGPGPDGIDLYDEAGAPVTGDVTSQVALWDAGTEIDQEPFVGSFTGPKQTAPDQGDPDPVATVRELPIDITLSDGSTFTRPAMDEMLEVTLTPGANRQFTLRVRNVSTDATLVTSAGARSVHVSPVVWALHTASGPFFTTDYADRGQGLELVAESGRGATLSATMAALSGAATPISRGVWALHDHGMPLFETGLADRELGLERQAEDGNPADLAAAMSAAEVVDSGIFDTPVGATMPGAARPGSAYEIHVTASPGDRLSFTTMFGMSDDWFFATEPHGIALFDGDEPVDRDVSDEIAIYDVGSEVDQELAIGPDTGPQQPAPNSGAADPIDQVRTVAPARYGTPASQHLRVTIAPE